MQWAFSISEMHNDIAQDLHDTLDCGFKATEYLQLCFVACDKKKVLATDVSRIERILIS